MIAPILENPIAVREWRTLRRRAGDWRIWVGVKWTLDPLVWGAPVVLTYAVAPYALWLVLCLLRGLHLVSGAALPVDPFLMVALVFAWYVVTISLVLGATAVTRERERQTWEQLWLTSLTGRERAAGFYWGRLGPVWASFLVTAELWWLLRPHYGPLLSAFAPVLLSRHHLAVGGLATLGLAMVAGLIGLLASALSQSTLEAVVSATLWLGYAITFLGLAGSVVTAPFFFWEVRGPIGNWFGVACALAEGVAVCFAPWGLWLSLAAGLSRLQAPPRRGERSAKGGGD